MDRQLAINARSSAGRLTFPQENAPNGNTQLLAQYDAVDDPEDQVDPATGKADIDKFADFIVSSVRPHHWR
jgi:hypothetical protein